MQEEEIWWTGNGTLVEGEGVILTDIYLEACL